MNEPQVMEYEAMPFLPPPLILFCDAYLLLKYCFRRRRGERKRWTFDYSLKLFLEEDDVEKVHDFEEESMDDLAKEKEYSSLTSTEERIRRTADRSEFILMKLNDMVSKEGAAKSRLTTLEDRIETVHSEMNRNIGVVLDRQQKILEALAKLPQTISTTTTTTRAIDPPKPAPSFTARPPPRSPSSISGNGMRQRKFPALALKVPPENDTMPQLTKNEGGPLLGISNAASIEDARNKSPRSVASTPGYKTKKGPVFNIA